MTVSNAPAAALSPRACSGQIGPVDLCGARPGRRCRFSAAVLSHQREDRIPGFGRVKWSAFSGPSTLIPAGVVRPRGVCRANPPSPDNSSRAIAFMAWSLAWAKGDREWDILPKRRDVCDAKWYDG